MSSVQAGSSGPSSISDPAVKSFIDSITPSPSPGETEKEKAEVTAWIDRATSGIQLSELNTDLKTRTYLVSNYPSLADFVVYAAVHPTVAKLTPAEYYALPSVTRWFDHIQHQPGFPTSSSSFSPVTFDIENAPKGERKTEVKVKKEKAPKAPAPEASVPKKDATPAVSTEAAEVPAQSEGKAKKEKKPKEPKAAGAAPASKDKAGKGAAVPASSDDSGAPIPSMIDLRVGHIVDVKKHPDADGLYVEQIDLGEPEGPRTVVSGLVNYIPIEEMRDKWLIAVCNLKPANMRGIKSFAMVLCASSKDGKDSGIELVSVPEASRIPGERIYFEGFEDKEPLAQLNPKKKIFETIQPGFTTLPTKEAAWVDSATGKTHLIKTQHGPCVAPTLIGASLS
ncbi:nucleic acid-binding protein [Sistotremastrum niveocremeum HHB9708]|uniref:Nucleic acid-binding protein n=1 Tax=Sistotremastrum niveocremeum HHB9708 TaxID=1314777 RepID=A0A164RCM0_9AGAM|nr:nucleic acid-binding protein [Sistotremastrum niveocremeum HHB9708]